MIQNYIFDFGNVLVHFSPQDMTAAYVDNKDDIELVESVVFDRQYWERLDKGTITDDEVRAEIQKRLPIDLQQKGCQIYEHWIELLPLIDGMEKVIADIKKQGKKVFLLSNISIGFAEQYTKNPQVAALLSQFDGLVFSGPIGLVKPERAIFQHILEKYDLVPHECLFVDDNLMNIQGAEAAGIQGYCFDGNVKKLMETILW